MTGFDGDGGDGGFDGLVASSGVHRSVFFFLTPLDLVGPSAPHVAPLKRHCSSDHRSGNDDGVACFVD